MPSERKDTNDLLIPEFLPPERKDTNNLLIPEFMPPERKDRLRDRHGGVMIYVKDTLFYKRIYDIEPQNTECNLIEIHLNHTRILFD